VSTPRNSSGNEIAGHEASSGSTRRAVLSSAAGLALWSISGRATIAALGTHGPREIELDFASAIDAAKLIRQGRVGSRELTRRMLERIRRFNPELNAVVNVLSDQALAQARQADEAQAHGDPLGPLHGVPILVKDAFEIANVPTTGGIPQLAQYRPIADSAVVRRLRAAGTVILGNTNVPFVLNDWQSYNSIYGTTNNPWDLKRTPGGGEMPSARHSSFADPEIRLDNAESRW